MDDKQYAVILHNAECSIGSIQDTEEYELCAAILKDAKRDLAAMRTPITAEALLAEGWRKTYQTEEYGGILEISAPEEFDNTCLWAHCVEFALDGTLKRVVDSRNRTIGGVRTMYDIGELVRLLGGAA